MSFADQSLRFTAITNALKTWMTANASENVTVEGVSVPSMAKQVTTGLGSFLTQTEREIRASGALVAAQTNQSTVAMQQVTAKATQVTQHRNDTLDALQQATLAKTVASAQAALASAALTETQLLKNQVTLAADSAIANLIARQADVTAKQLLATSAMNEARSKAELSRGYQAHVEDLHSDVATKAATVTQHRAQTLDALQQTNLAKTVASTQATLASSAMTETASLKSQVVQLAADVTARQADVTAKHQATTSAVVQAQTESTIAKNYRESVVQLHGDVKSQTVLVKDIDRMMALRAKAVDTQATLAALLSDAIKDDADLANLHRQSSASQAGIADTMRKEAQRHAADAQSAVAAARLERQQTADAANQVVALKAQLEAVYNQAMNQLEDITQHIEQTATMAQRIVTDFDAVPDATPGMVPMAKQDGQLDEAWLNNEKAYSSFVVGFAHLTMDALSKGLAIENVKTLVSDLQVSLTRNITALDKKIALEVANAKGQLPLEYFQGYHKAGEAHTLPVFNMTERDFLAEAAQEEGYAEFLRSQGASGIVNTRQYQADRGFELGYRVGDVSYAALNIHNHPNYQNQPGMAEASAIINGFYFRMRHMDYKTMYPIQGSYLARAATNAPAVAAEVQALPAGINPDGSFDFVGTQAGYMRDVKTAHPEDCQWQLAYLECWIEAQDGDALTDPADSFRHGNDASGFMEMFEKGRYLNYSGHKNRLENLSQQPFTVRYVDETGVPRFGIVQYRINTFPVGDLRALGGAETAPSFIVGNSASHYHTLNVALTSAQISSIKAGGSIEFATSEDSGHFHIVRISWDGAQYVAVDTHSGHQHPIIVLSDTNGRLPYNEEKAIAGVVDGSNRFRLVRDLRSRAHHASWQALARSRMARFECVDLLQLCEKLPGLQGDGAYLEESYTQYGLDDTLDNYAGTGRLNAARYNRRYRLFRDDASGRVTAHRGFNDPTLFVAKTTHSKVVGGFSWMIPMEMILRTPRENWNPFQLPTGNYNTLKAEEAANKGKTAATAFSGTNIQHFYYGMPVGSITEVAGQTDPADTANSAWVKDANGTPRLVYGNGIRVHDIDGVRQRFPVYPLWADHSHSQTQQHWLRKTIKTLFAKVASGQLTAADIDDLM